MRKAKGSRRFHTGWRGAHSSGGFFIVRKTDSEKKKKEMEQMKRNGCQARRCFVCVHKERRRAGGLFSEQLANRGRNKRDVCLKDYSSLREYTLHG